MHAQAHTDREADVKESRQRQKDKTVNTKAAAQHGTEQKSVTISNTYKKHETHRRDG